MEFSCRIYKPRRPRESPLYRLVEQHLESAHHPTPLAPVVVSVATAGDLLQWHPHLHLITTDGGRSAAGSWHTPDEWDAERLMRLFRERLLGSLLDKRAISQELVQKLLAWRGPG